MKNARRRSLPHNRCVIQGRVRSLRTHPSRSRSGAATLGNTWALQPALLLVPLVSLQETCNNLCNVFTDQTHFRHIIIVYSFPNKTKLAKCELAASRSIDIGCRYVRNLIGFYLQASRCLLSGV